MAKLSKRAKTIQEKIDRAMEERKQRAKATTRCTRTGIAQVAGLAVDLDAVAAQDLDLVFFSGNTGDIFHQRCILSQRPTHFQLLVSRSLR